ncbi:MAG: SRPBCC family protein [Alphaproteobacteria bacterium]
MELTGQHRIEGDPQAVWVALHDPDILSASIPGCRSLEKQDDGSLKAVFIVRLGAIESTLAGALRVQDVDAPHALTLTGSLDGEGADSLVGSVDIRLVAEDDGTALSYTARSELGGRLAEIGDEQIDGAARSVIDAFFAALAERAPESTLHRVEHAVEHVVEEAAHRVQDAAHDVEEAAEGAAVRGFLGGPTMWAVLALGALVVIVLFTQS